MPGLFYFIMILSSFLETEQPLMVMPKLVFGFSQVMFTLSVVEILPVASLATIPTVIF